MSDGRMVWRRGQDDEARRAVWEEHKQCGLDSDLAEIIKAVGPDQVQIIAIKRKS